MLTVPGIIGTIEDKDTKRTERGEFKTFTDFAKAVLQRITRANVTISGLKDEISDLNFELKKTGKIKGEILE